MLSEKKAQAVEKLRDRKNCKIFSCFVYCKTHKNSHLGN